MAVFAYERRRIERALREHPGHLDASRRAADCFYHKNQAFMEARSSRG